MEKTTIFDDVFQTMVEKIPKLLIPLVNEVFGRDFLLDEEIVFLPRHLNGGPEDDTKIVDTLFAIRQIVFHIECQSNTDPSMALRMVEYDFRSAFLSAEQKKARVEIRLPKSCVMDLSKKAKEPAGHLEVAILFPDEREVTYEIPVIYTQYYDQEELFRKRLLFLLPYYILRYVDSRKKWAGSKEKLDGMLSDYSQILDHIEDDPDILTEGNKRDLVELMKEISDYVFRHDATERKKVGDLMRGKVLHLQSDTIRELSEENNFLQTRLDSTEKANSLLQSKLDGMMVFMLDLIRSSKLDIETAAKQLQMPVSELKKML